MFAVAMTSGPLRSSASTLRSRRRFERAGSSIEYVPADPQQRCASATGTRSNPHRSSTPSTAPAARSPWLRVHGAWNATRGRRLVESEPVERHLVGRERLRDRFARVARERRDARRLLRVGGVVPEEVPVFADHRPASARGDDERLRAALDVRPPRVDVAAHAREGPARSGEVMVDRAAAAFPAGADEADAEPVEDPRRGRVDARLGGPLDAAREHQHAPAMAAGRAAPGPPRGRDHAPEPGGKEGTEQPAGEERETHEHRTGEPLADREADEPFGPGPAHLLLRELASDVDEPAVLHPRRTGRLAGAAGEAAVEVGEGPVGRAISLQDLLHEVDASPRAVQLVAEELVGGTGRVAEPAVHALSEDSFGLASLRGREDARGYRCLHGGGAVRM